MIWQSQINVLINLYQELMRYLSCYNLVTKTVLYFYDLGKVKMNDKTDAKQHTHLTGYAKSAKGKAGIFRIVKAAQYSKDGFVAAYTHEAAFRQVFWLNGVLIFGLIFTPFVMMVKMLLLTVSVFSLVVELFNTGLEAAIDHTSTDNHPLAKIGKDVGSAAQSLVLALLFMLWLMAVIGR